MTELDGNVERSLIDLTLTIDAAPACMHTVELLFFSSMAVETGINLSSPVPLP